MWIFKGTWYAFLVKRQGQFWIKLLLLILLAVVIFGVGYHIYLNRTKASFDGLMLKVFENIVAQDAYVERAETSVLVSGKRLVIDGIYRIDPKNDSFASNATTTLSTPSSKVKGDSFTLLNVSIGDDVYYQLSTQSKNLAYILTAGPGWHHFSRGTVPEYLQNVAISGPILDDLALFKSGPSYLFFVKKIGEVGSTTEYELKLSGTSPPPGTLQSLMEHIGADGKIRVWVNTNSALIQCVHFSGPDYESTTTIINYGIPQPIVDPVLSH